MMTTLFCFVLESEISRKPPQWPTALGYWPCGFYHERQVYIGRQEPMLTHENQGTMPTERYQPSFPVGEV